jgi:hypothetical protein
MYAFEEGFTPAIGDGLFGFDESAVLLSRGVSASSSRHVVYTSGSPLTYTRIGFPWMEGAVGPGEGVEIRIRGSSFRRVEALLISSGYVSFNSPELYRRYSRPRTIVVRSNSPDFEFEFVLADTPNIQRIDVPEPTSELILVLSDFYLGNEDENETCINFIVPLNFTEDEPAH